MPTIEQCRFIPEDGRRSWLCPEGSVIGRLGTVAQEYLQDTITLSRRHLLIERHDGSWVVIATPESKNDTYMSGELMERGRVYRLEKRRKFQVDTFVFSLDPTPLCDVPASPTPATLPLTEWPGAWIQLAYNGSIINLNEPAIAFCGRDVRGEPIDSVIQIPDGSLVTLCPREVGHTAVIKASLKTRKDVNAIRIAARNDQKSWLLSLEDITEQETQLATAQKKSQRLQARLDGVAEISRSFATQKGSTESFLNQLCCRLSSLLPATQVSIWQTTAAVRPHDPIKKVMRRSVFGDHILPYTQPLDIMAAKDFFKECQDHDWNSAAANSFGLSLLKSAQFVSSLNVHVLAIWVPLAGDHFAFILCERSHDQDSFDQNDAFFLVSLAGLIAATINSESHHTLRERAEKAEEQLKREFLSAEEFIRRSLPAPITDGPITVEWLLEHGPQMNGDSFGYFWARTDYFAMYVIDVIGAGTAAALRSSLILDYLRTHAGEDHILRPAEVLKGLHRVVSREEPRGLAFRIWYGVYNTKLRSLSYANAGLPPALLIQSASIDGPTGPSAAVRLETSRQALGETHDASFITHAVEINKGTKLFLQTKGTFSFHIGPDREWSFDEYAEAVSSTRFMEFGETLFLKQRAASLTNERFPDDFCVLRFSFME